MWFCVSITVKADSDWIERGPGKCFLSKPFSLSYEGGAGISELLRLKGEGRA